MDWSYQEEKEDSSKVTTERIITKYLIPFGMFLVAGITLLATKAPLPNWAFWSVIAYFVISLGIILANPIYKLYLAIRKKSSEKSLYRYFQPQLQRIVEEFKGLLKDDSSNTIPYLIKELYSQPNERSVIGENLIGSMREHIDTIERWIDTIKKCLNSHSNNLFKDIVSDFSYAIRDYNDICDKLQKQLDILITSGKIADHRIRQLKQEWNERRERHSAFLIEWERLGNEINKKFSDRSNYCCTYFNTPKTLE